jgi:hypothetical protein
MIFVLAFFRQSHCVQRLGQNSVVEINPPPPIFFGSVAAADHSAPTLHLCAVLQVTLDCKNSSLAVLAVATCSRSSSPLQLLQ